MSNLKEKVLIKAKESFFFYSSQVSPSRVKDKRYMVIIDYTLHSKHKRLFVYDRLKEKVIRSHHCAHGKGSSSPGNVGKAVNFSNTVMSKCSSVGPAVTGRVYYGRYGRSLNLHGLVPSNDNMFKRRIVLHKSKYVTDAYIRYAGRCGQSWGCTAVDPAIKDSLIDLIKGGTFMYLHGGVL